MANSSATATITTKTTSNTTGGGSPSGIVQFPTPQQQQQPAPAAMMQQQQQQQQQQTSSQATAGDSSAGEDDKGSSSDGNGGSSAVPESVASIRPTAGTKRTLMTHSKDGKLLSEKKLRRLEKNRLSARECRRRKREATEHLEREINVIEAENLRLRLQLQIGKEAEKSRMREQDKLTQDINDLLKSGASEADIHATLEEFKEKHADYGKSRRSAIEFHLRNIERLLMPTQTTSLVMHAIQGGDLDVGGSNAAAVPATAAPPAPATFPKAAPPAALKSEQPAAADAAAPSTVSQAPESSAETPPPNNLDPKSLFQYLVNYLEVSPDQAAALKDSRRVSKELDGCLETALSVLKELRQCLAQTGDDLEAEFNNIRKILTPTQAAKFLVWVANNGACMHMLNELWDRVYPAGMGGNNSEEERTP